MKKLILTSLVLAACLSVQGKTISPDEALRRAASPDVKQAPAMGAGPRLAMTVKTESGAPAAYLFDKGERGYMILSADDLAYPVLGYSDNGTIDTSDIPPQLKWWLDEYAAQIEYATKNGAEPMTDPVAVSDAVIEPMLETKWDQTEPYNNMCPMSRGQRTPTGCAATAMAQVMKYWNYPACGKGTISYQAEKLGKRLSLDFSLRDFEWDKMLPAYTGAYTDEQASAVAYLMKAAGYSIQMNYDLESSGAFAVNIGPALEKYFDYDPGFSYVRRVNYSPEEWQTMLIENLEKVGPVLYSGNSQIGGGHEFVCDGYDGKGYFHFNWGWSGMSDGYFVLDALNPSSLGTGGGSGGGFNFSQDMVLGIRPLSDNPVKEKEMVITQNGSLEGVVDGSFLKLSLYGSSAPYWSNLTSETLYFKYGVIAESLDEPGREPVRYTLSPNFIKLSAGYYSSQKSLSVYMPSLKLPDGKYKLSVATLFRDTEEWVPVRAAYGNYNYVIVTRSGDTYSVEAYQQVELKLETGRILTDVYYGSPVEVEVTVTNPCDIAFSGGFAPVLYRKGESSPSFRGESIRLTLQPGETVTRKWATDLYQLQQGVFGLQDEVYEFSFFNEMTGTSYINVFNEDVTMLRIPATPTVELLGAPFIEDAEVKQEIINGRYYDVYQVTDKRHIRIASDYQLVSGTLATWVYNTILCESANQPGYMDILLFAGDPVFESEEFTQLALETEMDFLAGKAGELYFVAFTYLWNNQINPVGDLTCFRIVDNSGVESVTVDESPAPAEVFNLQGVKVGDSTAGLAPGIYIVRQGDKVTKVSVR